VLDGRIHERISRTRMKTVVQILIFAAAALLLAFAVTRVS
jgi:hypothetical protein